MSRPMNPYTITRRRGKGRPKGSQTLYKLSRAMNLPQLPRGCPSAYVALDAIINKSGFHKKIKLSDAMGCSRQHLSNVMLGKSPMGLSLLWNFCWVLKISPNLVAPIFIRIWEEAQDRRLAMGKLVRLEKSEAPSTTQPRTNYSSLR